MQLQVAGVGKINGWVLELNFAGQFVNIKSLSELFIILMNLFISLFIHLHLFIYSLIYLSLNEFCKFH